MRIIIENCLVTEYRDALSKTIMDPRNEHFIRHNNGNLIIIFMYRKTTTESSQNPRQARVSTRDRRSI